MKRIQYICQKSIVETVELLVPDEHDAYDYYSEALNVAEFSGGPDSFDYNVLDWEILEVGIEENEHDG